jgi:hypothetical protein
VQEIIYSRRNSLFASAGMYIGKEKMTTEKRVHSKRTQLATRPAVPNQYGPWGMLSRPRNNRQMTGML